MNMKTCIKCDETKEFSEFYKRKDSKDGFNNQCKVCLIKKVKSWQKANPEKLSWIDNPQYSLRRKLKRYNISSEEYDNLLEKSNKSCALCESSEKLVIDHDHTTGKVRGILCGTCNKGLGMLGDSIESLYKALNYLNRAQ